MGSRESRLLDGEGLEALLGDLATRILARRSPGVPLRLIGVRTRGVPIADRLATRLRGPLGEEIPVGALDITLYRDDLGLRPKSWPVLRGTEVPFDVEGCEVVLVDDVLYTGRTIRAALNEVCDLGRPACIRLAVVADRGGRELPIQADYVGRELQAPPGRRVIVRIAPIDDAREEGIVLIGGPSG